MYITCNQGASMLKSLGYMCKQPRILYVGVTFQFFSLYYHYEILYFGLIEKMIALLIILSYVLCHTL